MNTTPVALWSGCGPITPTKIIEQSSGSCLALLLFGSRAYGDYDEHSDVDIIQLCATDTKDYSVGKYNYHCHTVEGLTRLGLKGDLFFKHLADVGQVVYDPDSLFPAILAQYVPQTDYQDNVFLLYSQAKEAEQVGWLRYNLFKKYHTKRASTILASCIYLRAAICGNLVWGLKHQARLYNDPNLLRGRRLRDGVITGHANYLRVVSKALDVLWHHSGEARRKYEYEKERAKETSSSY